MGSRKVMVATPVGTELASAGNPNALISNVSEPITSWGEGSGLKGDVFTPSDVDSLINILEKIEFKAVVESDDYIRYSNLEARVSYYDENNIHNSTSFNIWNNAHDGDDYNGQSITALSDSTVIEYGENLKDSYGIQNFMRNVARGVDNASSDSGFIFINPERFRADSILNGNGSNLERQNALGILVPFRKCSCCN